MFDFKLVFLPVFDPCTIHSHLTLFFFYLLLHNFHFLGFSNTPQSLFLPTSSLSALVFISIQHLSVAFFRNSQGHPDYADNMAWPFDFPYYPGSLVSSF